MIDEKSWGSYEVMGEEPGWMTVKVTLMPGHSMNYHSHKERDEVWVVLSGEGKTTVDGMEQNIQKGDIISIAAGCKHTVCAYTELKLAEVQIGDVIDVGDKVVY